MPITFDEYYAARPSKDTPPFDGAPLSNGYPVAQSDMASVVTVTPGALVFALTAFSGALKGKFVGTGMDCYGEPCVRVQLTADGPNTYRRGEIIDVKPDAVYLRSARHSSNRKYWFTPTALYFTEGNPS